MAPIKIGRPAVAIALFVGFGAPISGKADAIDHYLTSQMQRLHIPGASLAIVRDGHIIKAQGYGFANLELKAPATKKTVYEIGSNTKQFTAAAIMMLVEEGKVALEDSITKYFPKRRKPGATSQSDIYSPTHPAFKITSQYRTGSTFSEPISHLRRSPREMSCSRCFSNCLLSFSRARAGPTITPVIIYSELSLNRSAVNLIGNSG
jgi:Beta-lactamase